MDKVRLMTIKKDGIRRMVSTAAAIGLLLGASIAYSDPQSLAPPVDQQSAPGDQGAASADNVFKWTEIPENQQVPIDRAVFDRGGYQLYDTAGETIVIPFENRNLYVMKFALSADGSTYFINDNGTPVLYVPQNGYLENATVSGARWYPFSDQFHPADPVYLGIAPNWTDFVGMGWYPDMFCYGGYYCHTSFITGGIFLPCLGFSFFIGGHSFFGWGGYHDYFIGHPAPFRVGFYNRDFYRWANRPNPNHAFLGGGGGFRGGRTFSDSGRSFHGADRTFGDVHSGAAGHSSADSRPAGGHVFRGADASSGHSSASVGSGGGHSFSGGGSGHSFSGGGGGHSFSASHSSSGGGHGGGGGDHRR